MQALQERLARGDVLILDGPTATELERKGVSNASNAWSALANLHHPDVVRSVHEDYIRAGADVITTNTFPTSRLALETVGLAGRTREVNMRAVAIASEARERAAGSQEVAIAGSISHFLGWDRDDQGRYQFRDRPSMERLRKAFQEQAEVLAEAGCDLILLEMMRDVEMAGHAMEAAASTGLPVWTGFTCWVDSAVSMVRIGERQNFAGGPPLEEALKSLQASGGSLMAVMHTPVEATLPALEAMKRAWDGPLGAYAHSGAMERPNWRFDAIISPEAYLRHAQQWVALGVQLVGACCGMGPEHIRLLKERLPQQVRMH